MFCHFRFEGGGGEECSLLAEALSIALQVCKVISIYMQIVDFSKRSIKLGQSLLTLYTLSISDYKVNQITITILNLLDEYAKFDYCVHVHAFNSKENGSKHALNNYRNVT